MACSSAALLALALALEARLASLLSAWYASRSSAGTEVPVSLLTVAGKPSDEVVPAPREVLPGDLGAGDGGVDGEGEWHPAPALSQALATMASSIWTRTSTASLEESATTIGGRTKRILVRLRVNCIFSDLNFIRGSIFFRPEWPDGQDEDRPSGDGGDALLRADLGGGMLGSGFDLLLDLGLHQSGDLVLLAGGLAPEEEPGGAP